MDSVAFIGDGGFRNILRNEKPDKAFRNILRNEKPDNINMNLIDVRHYVGVTATTIDKDPIVLRSTGGVYREIIRIGNGN